MMKTEAVNARVLPEEKAALKALARLERRKPSEQIRELIRAEAARRQLWPPAAVGGEVKR